MGVVQRAVRRRILARVLPGSVWARRLGCLGARPGGRIHFGLRRRTRSYGKKRVAKAEPTLRRLPRFEQALDGGHHVVVCVDEFDRHPRGAPVPLVCAAHPDHAPEGRPRRGLANRLNLEGEALVDRQRVGREDVNARPTEIHDARLLPPSRRALVDNLDSREAGAAGGAASVGHDDSRTIEPRDPNLGNL